MLSSLRFLKFVCLNDFVHKPFCNFNSLYKNHFKYGFFHLIRSLLADRMIRVIPSPRTTTTTSTSPTLTATAPQVPRKWWPFLLKFFMLKIEMGPQVMIGVCKVVVYLELARPTFLNPTVTRIFYMLFSTAHI